MSRLAAIDPLKANGKAKELLDMVQSKLGIIPNMTRTMVNSPVVLEGYLQFSGLLSNGLLNGKLREQIALAVAEVNSCDYCLSAHTAIGKMVGLNDSDINESRRFSSPDPKVNSVLKFARTVVKSHGRVAPDEINSLRQAGYNDAEIAEVIANIALNVFTNYFNNIAQPEVDFPKISAMSKEVN